MENLTTDFVQSNDQLKNEYELIKSFYEFPRMNFLYLENYFNDLKSEIDMAFFLQLAFLSKEKQKLNSLNEIWTNITNRVNSFQRECLEAQDSNFLLQMKEDTMDNLDKIDLELEKNEFESVKSLIYDEKAKIEKNLFDNKTIAFLNSSLLFKDDSEQTNLAGKLLIIKDEYIGNTGLDYLRG